jgi:hypothetical protein
LLLKQINKYQNPTPPVRNSTNRRRRPEQQKPKFKAGSIEHKQHIFETTYNSVCNEEEFEPGTQVYIRGHRNRTGQIISLIDDFDKIEWQDLKACFVEVWFPSDDDFGIFHPSDVKELR